MIEIQVKDLNEQKEWTPGIPRKTEPGVINMMRLNPRAVKWIIQKEKRTRFQNFFRRLVFLKPKPSPLKQFKKELWGGLL